jgi:hypothetical protein
MFVCELKTCSSTHRVEFRPCLSCLRCVLNDDPKEERVPPPPTNARPGSEAKLRILQWRMEHDFGLWNPADATEEAETVKTRFSPRICRVVLR